MFHVLIKALFIVSISFCLKVHVFMEVVAQWTIQTELGHRGHEIEGEIGLGIGLGSYL